jgi:CheY-like chemotaxis protein
MAQQANQSKTRFVVAASHDLLQPLGAARLFNAALRGRAVADPELANLAERVDNSLAAAGELLEGLLDISRLEAGGVKADISEFCIVDLLTSLQEQFAPLAAARGLELRVIPTGMRVRSDQHLLRRIIQNFISNALRYTPSGSVLLGCRRRANSQVEVQVIDTGPGIPPENSRTIFEEFQRLDQQSPWGEKGLGLGLSICERISVIVGAELTLRSTTAHGSVFGVRVARAPDLVAAFPAPPPQNSSPETPERSGARILCVEDDGATLEALRELLVTWGFKVFTAASPEAAEELIRAQPVDVLLADFHLQGRAAGLDMLQRMLASGEPGAPRAGALLTAAATEAVVERAEELGIPVLRKPVKPAALRALVSALVARANQVGSSTGGAS